MGCAETLGSTPQPASCPVCPPTPSADTTPGRQNGGEGRAPGSIAEREELRAGLVDIGPAKMGAYEQPFELATVAACQTSRLVREGASTRAGRGSTGLAKTKRRPWPQATGPRPRSALVRPLHHASAGSLVRRSAPPAAIASGRKGETSRVQVVIGLTAILCGCACPYLPPFGVHPCGFM